MSYQARDNSGSAFRNDRKREGKQDADFTGDAMIDGKTYWLDIWQNPPKDGKKGYFSVKFRPKTARGSTAPPDQRGLPTRPKPVPPKPPTERDPNPLGIGEPDRPF